MGWLLCWGLLMGTVTVADADSAACPGTPCAASRSTVNEVWAETREGRVLSDLYLPPIGMAQRGGAILAHGFLRSRKTMRDHALALAAQGIVALVPDLPYRANPAGNARALRELALQLEQGRFGVEVKRVVLVGFSAGALAAVLAAPEVPGLAGFVALDPFDRPNHPGLASAQRLSAPTTVLHGPPAACNGYGSAAPWAGVLPQLDLNVLIPHATHCDFEAPTTLACRLACFGSDDARRSSIQQSLVAAVTRYLPQAVDP